MKLKVLAFCLLSYASIPVGYASGMSPSQFYKVEVLLYQRNTYAALDEILVDSQKYQEDLEPGKYERRGSAAAVKLADYNALLGATKWFQYASSRPPSLANPQAAEDLQSAAHKFQEAAKRQTVCVEQNKRCEAAEPLIVKELAAATSSIDAALKELGMPEGDVLEAGLPVTIRNPLP